MHRDRGESIVASLPFPVSGTPTGWTADVANTTGSTVTFDVYVVCASP